jgi:hypothetical protein
MITLGKALMSEFPLRLGIKRLERHRDENPKYTPGSNTVFHLPSLTTGTTQKEAL